MAKRKMREIWVDFDEKPPRIAMRDTGCTKIIALLRWCSGLVRFVESPVKKARKKK